MRRMSNNQQGFTIPEVITVMVVLAILSAIVLSALGNLYYDNIQTTAQTTQDTETRGVLRTLEKTVTSAGAFSASVTVPAPMGPGNNTTNLTWSYKGNDTTNPDNRVFIASAIATDKSPTDETRLPVFQNTGAGCTIDKGVPVVVQNIYFVAPDYSSATTMNLYRRTAVMPTASLCGTTFQKNTCLASVVAANPSVCQSADALLLRNVTGFAVDYYASPNDTAPIADQYSTSVDKSADIAAAKTAKLTVTTKQKVNGKDMTSIAELRVSRSY